MKTKVLLIILLTVPASTIFGQRIETLRFEMFSGYYEPINRTLNYDDVEGSPYLDPELIKGYVKFRLGDTADYFLRYNIYADEMEYLDGDKLFVINNPDQVDVVAVNNHELYYTTYKFRNSFKKGFLEKLVDGHYALYIKYNIDYEKRKEARSSYEKPIPDRFVKKSPTWYCSIDNGPIKNFENDNSGLEELFRQDYPDVKAYIKSEKLKLRKPEDVIKLFEYFNSAH